MHDRGIVIEIGKRESAKEAREEKTTASSASGEMASERTQLRGVLVGF